MKLNYSTQELSDKTRKMSIKDIRVALGKYKSHILICETKTGYVKKVGLFDHENLVCVISKKKYSKAIMPELSFSE